MAVTDNFDTAATGELTDHETDTGQSWLVADADNSDFNIIDDAGGDHILAAFGQLVAIPDDTLLSTDHFSEVRGRTVGANATDRFGAVVGSDRGDYANGTFIFAAILGDGSWLMFEVDAGSATLRDGPTAIAGFSESTLYDLKLWVDDSDSAHVSIDDTEVTDTDGIATTITLGSAAGVYARGSGRIRRLETGLNNPIVTSSGRRGMVRDASTDMANDQSRGASV